MTTQGGAGSESVRAVGTPAAPSTSLAKLFDPSMRAAAALGPKTGKPTVTESVAYPRDQRRLGPDDSEIGPERGGELKQPVAVVGRHRMAGGGPGDPGVPGCGVQLLSAVAAPGARPGRALVPRSRRSTRARFESRAAAG